MSEVADQALALWEGALEEARGLIGVELRRGDHRWNTDAHPDSVRHFCAGIGDDNPLFADPGYGKGTRWVVDKRMEDGVHLVDLKIHVENQLDEKTATGTATAELPAGGARG